MPFRDELRCAPLTLRAVKGKTSGLPLLRLVRCNYQSSFPPSRPPKGGKRWFPKRLGFWLSGNKTLCASELRPVPMRNSALASYIKGVWTTLIQLLFVCRFYCFSRSVLKYPLRAILKPLSGFCMPALCYLCVFWKSPLKRF